jgi:hypothetical protein
VPGGARAEGGDCITLKSYGLDLASRADQFFLLSQQFQGDGSIVAKLSAGDWAMGSKLGVMLREDLTPGSRHFSMYFVSLATGNKFQCVRRETAEGAAGFPKTSTVTFTIPDGWVRVQRLGTTVTGSFSTDGAAWTELVAWTTSTLPDSLLGGLFASSGAIAGAAGVQATFCEIETTGTVGPTTETDCDDEIDNDGDLATDCADSDCASAPNCQTTGTPFHRGDSNADGSINITDGIYILNYLFLGGPTPTCLEAANPNDDAQINITDGIYVLNFLFLGGPAPANPGPADSPCGVDPVGSPTDLGCVEYTKC